MSSYILHKSNRANIKCNVSYESMTMSLRYRRGTIFKDQLGSNITM